MGDAHTIKLWNQNFIVVRHRIQRCLERGIFWLAYRCSLYGIIPRLLNREEMRQIVEIARHHNIIARIFRLQQVLLHSRADDRPTRHS